MAEKNTKTTLLDHSAAKVQLLGGYLKRFLNIIANDGYTRRIRVYDLFCGEGVYANQGAGSPIVIMRTVKDLYFTQAARSKNSPAIDCYFNDIEAEKVENVRQSIQNDNLHYSQIGTLEYSNRDYKIAVKELLDTLPPSK